MKVVFFLLSLLYCGQYAAAQIIDDSVPDASDESKYYEIEEKVEKLEKQFNLFSKEMLKSSASAARKRGDNTAPEIYLDQIQIRVDRLEQNVRNYVNEIERLNNRVDTLNKRLDKINDDYKVRFELLEKSVSEIKNRPPVESQSKNSPAPVKTSDKVGAGQAADAIVDTPDELYKAAIEYIKKSDYVKAENNLKIVINKYPKHALASNAMYWLGETYYVRADYKNAVAAFADGVKKYGKGAKGPDSLLKLGYSYKKLKKNREACMTFVGLPVKYPKAEKSLLTRAKKEAADLKCEQVTAK